MNELILDLINDARTILLKKYGWLRKAGMHTSMYPVFLSVQKHWDKAPLKKIAQLKRFVDDNKDLLQ